jgi:hypothetical protein
MSNKSDIIKSLREITKSNSYSKTCEVIQIDTSSNTCDVAPVDGSAHIPNVRLNTSQTGYLIIPKEGSLVDITFTDPDNAFVSMFSEVDDIKIKVSNEIHLNGDGLGGLIKISDLVGKLNDIEDLVNNLLTTLQSTTIPLAPSGTYPFAPLYATFQMLVNTQVNDIENDKVKHGN